MKNCNVLFLLAFIFSFFISCDKIDTNEANPCVFVETDTMDGVRSDFEAETISECLENALTEKNEIEVNLIGKWILIGHSAGWNVNESQPCSEILIKENVLEYTFKNALIDTLIVSPWEVIIGENNIYLSSEAINLSNFCEQFMFKDNGSLDGNMYLYNKVN